MDTPDTLAATTHVQPKPSQNGLFSIDPGLTIWTWVVFALLFVVLRKFAWSPLMDSVKKREKTITDAIDDAKRLKNELNQIAQKQQEMQAEANKQAQSIIEQGRTAAQAVADKIKERSQQEAAEEFQRIKEQIAAEKQNAFNQLRGETVELIVQATQHLIQANLDDDEQKKIVTKFLESM